MVLIMSRPLGVNSQNLEIYEDNNEYILTKDGHELARASGEQALSMMHNYFIHYYNIAKHMLYPKMPYSMSELGKILEENNKLFDELSEKYAYLDASERIEKIIKEYSYLKEGKNNGH